MLEHETFRAIRDRPTSFGGLPVEQLVGAMVPAYVVYDALNEANMYKALALAFIVYGIVLSFLKYMIRRNPYWLEYAHIRHTRYVMKRYIPRW